MEITMKEIVKEIREEFSPPHTFVQNWPDGRGERHLHGIVGILWRIEDPESVRIGNCFLQGRLKTGDLFLCIGHSGDCFQSYMRVKEAMNCLIGDKRYTFGSYGIGDSVQVELADGEFEILKNGGRVERDDYDKNYSGRHYGED